MQISNKRIQKINQMKMIINSNRFSHDLSPLKQTCWVWPFCIRKSKSTGRFNELWHITTFDVKTCFIKLEPMIFLYLAWQSYSDKSICDTKMLWYHCKITKKSLRLYWNKAWKCCFKMDTFNKVWLKQKKKLFSKLTFV